MPILNKLLEFGIYLFIFLLPWQTRLFLREGALNGGFWEYGSISLYATDVLFLGLAVCYVICVGAGILPAPQYSSGRAETLRSRLKNLLQPRGAKYYLLFIIFFLLISASLSILWSPQKFITLYFSLRVLEGIALFLIIKRLHLPIKRLSFAILAAGIIQATLGVEQFILQDDILGNNKWLGVASHDPKELGVSVVEYGEYRWLRAYGSFPHPNILGGWLVISLMIALEWYLDVARRWKGILAPLDLKRLKIERLGAVLSLVMLFCGLIFTFSRSAFLGLGVAFLFYFIFRFKDALLEEKKDLVGNLGKVLGIWLLCFLSFYGIYGNLIGARWISSGRLEEKSITERSSQISDAVSLIKKYPVWGVGAGNYTYKVSTDLYPGKPSWFYQPVHNVYLLIVSELGILGLIFLILGFGWIGYNIKKAFKENLPSWVYLYLSIILGFAVIALFDHYLWTLAVGMWMGFVLIINYKRSFNL